MCRFPVVSLTGKGENIYGRQSSEGSSAKQNEICVQPRRNSFASGLRHDRCPALRIGATNRDRDRSGGRSFHRGGGKCRFFLRNAEPAGGGGKKEKKQGGAPAWERLPGYTRLYRLPGLG